MTIRHTGSESAAELLERRWFAALKAASTTRAECETLLEAIERTKVAWNRARARLAELESLRDSLGDELAALDAERDERARRDAGAANGARRFMPAA